MTHFDKHSAHLSHNLNWVHLGIIISASFTLPMIMVGSQLTKQYGAGTAISSICVGNLILWLIGLAVISMAIDNRSNALENMRPYLGKYGTIIVWFILTASLVNWFVHQTSLAIPSIGLYFSLQSKSSLVRLGAGIAFFTTLLSIWGLSLIKRVISFTFPFILIYHIYNLYNSDYSTRQISTWTLSFPAIVSTVLVLFPGILNLPTLFRHSRSKGDCYLGLTVMFVLISLFEISTVWMKVTDNFEIIYTDGKISIFSISSLYFIISTLVQMNLLNIYFSSVCWETYVPRFEGAKGNVIIGLSGTALYTMIQVYTPIEIFQNVTNCYLANLGVVLLVSYMVQIIVNHRPRSFEKVLNGFCWFVGCFFSTFLTILDTHDGIHPLLMGAAASAATFLCIIFVEENLWATRKILLENRSK